jgi:hypothetical protein
MGHFSIPGGAGVSARASPSASSELLLSRDSVLAFLFRLTEVSVDVSDPLLLSNFDSSMVKTSLTEAVD